MPRLSKPGYSRLQITLHWLTLIGIAAAYLTGEDTEDALRQRIQTGETGFEGNTLHIWIGSALFAIILFRVLVRLISAPVAPVAQGPAWAHQAALWGHRVLYLLILMVPAAGMAAWYGQVPDAGEVHEAIINLLLVVALGHALMAFYHQYVVRDGTLTRMLRRP